MVFKRLLGSKGSGGTRILLEIDTVIPDEALQPGGLLRGEIVLRAPDRDVRVRTVNVKLVANASPAVGKSDVVDTESGDTFAHFPVTSQFTVEKGQEARVPPRYRLQWESPVSEVQGRQLQGVRLALYTEVEADGIEDRTDSDPLRIGATARGGPRRLRGRGGTPAGARRSPMRAFRVPSATSVTCDRACASSTRWP